MQFKRFSLSASLLIRNNLSVNDGTVVFEKISHVLETVSKLIFVSSNSCSINHAATIGLLFIQSHKTDASYKFTYFQSSLLFSHSDIDPPVPLNAQILGITK